MEEKWGMECGHIFLREFNRRILSILSAVHKQPLTSNPDAQGLVNSFHYPPTGTVLTAIGWQSDQANAEVEIELGQPSISLRSVPGDPRPWVEKVQPGTWNFEMKFQNFPPVIHNNEALMPPTFPWDEPV